MMDNTIKIGNAIEINGMIYTKEKIQEIIQKNQKYENGLDTLLEICKMERTSVPDINFQTSEGVGQHG